ncbi:PKD domain-containing protein [Rhodohalobacter mucosus]|uniref:Uncharacterized protein n=1 Tax=Rhodohalobacter mucosus TaxID=2079485 RepID=A0A316TQF7_9BACT|nr:hypothetical protein [Rhodohalobacter mucosus]PWN06837.1 hypothetical protein DDZ15_06065 [Rhodohalobacter mucosus]
MNLSYYLKGILISVLLLGFIASCGDDNPAEVDVNPPSLTAPGAQEVVLGNSVTLSFSVTISGGYASAQASAQNGSANVTTEPASGATSGAVEVEFTPNSVGAASVTLTVTDSDGQTDDATAVVTVVAEQTVFQVTENISSNTTWETGNTYILGGRITVLAGATLTIEPGVIVKGEAGTGANATALLIARDGTLNANGEANAPIIFTSFADEITPEQVAAGDFTSPNLDPDISGLWGGVLILGNAPISASSEGSDITETQIEGIPTSDSNGLYGGNDPSDSSGSITHISIRHGGANIGEGNEINGLTLGGVGSGTNIQNVEVVANQDDGIEWFGGTVDVTNVLVWNSFDDAIDTDQAWAGTLDNAVIVSPEDSAFELDGPEGSFTSTGHTIQNATIYLQGNGAEELIDVDDNTDVSMNNLLFFGLDEGGSLSSDYPDYAANPDGYAITSIEAIIPAGFTVTDFFPGLESEVTEIADLNAATLGADASVFGWTWASQSGALGSLGVE